MTEEQILIDNGLVRRIARERGGVWLGRGAAATALLAVAGLCLLPQSFTATSSVSIQQSQSSLGGALGLLGAASPDDRRYIGILKSRMLAAEVESTVHLRALYGLKSEFDAVEMLTKSIKPEDSQNDGLLYVNVTLPGPARFMPGAGARRVIIEGKAAETANAYVAALRSYLIYSDTDRDSVLVRGADEELNRTQADFAAASDRLRGFVSGLDRLDPRASPGDNAADLAASTGLPALYQQLGQVETQISGMQAGASAERRLTADQLTDVAAVPAEDPMLSSARSAVDQDQAALDYLQSLYGPEHPQVARARARLAADQRQLAQQVSGMRAGKTSRQVALESQLVSLTARRDALQSQIRQAERHLSLGRRMSSDYLSVKTQWAIALEAYKQTRIEAEKVRLENVSAQSRIAVVDTAVPPKSGSPGAILILALSLVLSLLGVAAAFVRTYLREAHAAPLMPAGVAGRNGAVFSPGEAAVAEEEARR